MRNIARKLAETVRPTKPLPGEPEAQVAALRSILHAAVLRKKNIDPAKLLKWLESGQEMSEISIVPPPVVPTLIDKISPQNKDCPLVLNDEEIRGVGLVAELRQEIVAGTTAMKRSVAVRRYTGAVQELILRVNGYEYPEDFNYHGSTPLQDKVLES